MTANVVPQTRVLMEGIEKSFGSVKVLRGATLSVAAGEVVGLVGDNGAGKSTLMKILAGALTPDAGRVWINGEVVALRTPKDALTRHIDMVYQDLALCEDLDVARNLFLGRQPTRFGFLDIREMHTAAAHHLRGLGITIPSTRLVVRNLSGGQRQTIAIARAATFDPSVLIMDEPTAALAVIEVDSVLKLIRRLSDMGVSVILVTHRLQDLFVVCDRIVVMYEGQIQANLNAKNTTIEELVYHMMGRQPTTESALGRANA